jgi:hypothetical protein
MCRGRNSIPLVPHFADKVGGCLRLIGQALAKLPERLKVDRFARLLGRGRPDPRRDFAAPSDLDALARFGAVDDFAEAGLGVGEVDAFHERGFRD